MFWGFLLLLIGVGIGIGVTLGAQKLLKKIHK